MKLNCEFHTHTQAQQNTVKKVKESLQNLMKKKNKSWEGLDLEVQVRIV